MSLDEPPLVHIIEQLHTVLITWDKFKKYSDF